MTQGRKAAIELEEQTQMTCNTLQLYLMTKGLKREGGCEYANEIQGLTNNVVAAS